MLGLTSIDLPFLGNPRSNWVVVIGLDLLSLACPDLDLGSVMLHYIGHPCCCYGYVDPISVENRIWGDRNGICLCDADGSRLSKWFYDTSTGAATGAARCGSFVGGALVSWLLAMREYGGHEDLRGSGRRSVIPYVHG
jgi:hypothetical protein